MLGNTTLAKNGFGSQVVTTNDGEVLVTLSDEGDFSYLYCYVELYNDAAGTQLAAPLAGTIEFQASPLGKVFLPLTDGGTLNAADINNGNYTPPIFDGHAEKAKVIFNSIINAPFARVMFWRND